MPASPTQPKASDAKPSALGRNDKRPDENDETKFLQDQLKGDAPRKGDGTFGSPTRNAAELLQSQGSNSELPPGDRSNTKRK